MEKLQFSACILLAFCSAWSICRLIDLRGGTAFSHSLFSLLIWLGLSALFCRTFAGWREEKDAAARSRRLWFAGVFSLLAGLSMTAGYQLQWRGYTEPGFVGKGKMLVQGALIGLAALPLADACFRWLGESRKAVRSREAEGGRRPMPESGGGRKPWRLPIVFLSSWLGIWLCWIPVWLAYYPVIMSYDFHKQSLEALLGPQYFNNHHPLAHTWLIYVFRGLGERLGSYETGFACFSLFQQMIVSAVLGYACVTVYRLLGRRRAAVCSALFFGCFPLVSVFVMCTTKDVLFGAFFVLFLLLMVERQFFGGGVRADILWVLSGILMILFRNNALYAMLPFGILYVLAAGKKKRLRALILTLLLLAGGKGALMGIQYGFHAHVGSEIEKYSVIYQSMARVGRMQRGNLDAETYELLDTYVTAECWEDYNPVLADTIKSPVQRENFNNKKSWDDLGGVLSAWIRVGLRYPNEYIDAFLDLTRGYWFWDDTSHAEMLGVGAEERMGLLYTYNSAAEESLPGMQHLSKFPWLEERLEKVFSENAYYDWPVVSNLFKPALWCWLLVFYLFYALYQKDRGTLLIGLYPAAYFATMLLGPTAIVRYVFQFIIAMPLLYALLLSGKSRNPSAQEEQK
ncbi:MAG: DUF6020 family protein [Muribaculum sp.]|nr:DUF6020 family protein [Muribaculum sp.]